jgi:hypothetical protein
MIPPFVQSIIGVVVRAAVVFLVGWVAAHGGPTFTQDQVTKFIAEATPLAAVLLWSFYQKFRARQKLMVAQAAPHPLSENNVEMLVASGQAPSVMTPKHESPTLTRPPGDGESSQKNP